MHELIPFVRWPFISPSKAELIINHELIQETRKSCMPTQNYLKECVKNSFSTSYDLPMRKSYESWLYVLGGEQSFLMEMKSCEFFNHSSAVWDYGFSLNGPRTSFAAVTLGEKLYVIGGMRFGGKLKIVELYCHRRRTWKRLASLKKCQGDVEAAVINEVIYVVGGSSEGEPACR